MQKEDCPDVQERLSQMKDDHALAMQAKRGNETASARYVDDHGVLLEFARDVAANASVGRDNMLARVHMLLAEHFGGGDQ